MRTAIAIVALACTLLGCGNAGTEPTTAPAGRLLIRGGPAPALAALPGAGLLVGFLRTGAIWRVPAHGTPRRTFPRLRVSTNGQRGLLSLIVLRGKVYAAWTTPARRLVVGRLRAHSEPTIIWRGVPTATLANGGHLAVTADRRRLVIGIGDRQAGTPVGRILSLDPGGPASQTPRTLSAGWNNPFALTFTPDGHLWVADNAPGKHPERLARGDEGAPTQVTTLDRRPAPSGLAAIDDRTLALCGVVSGTLDRYTLGDAGRWRHAGTIAKSCRYGVARLSDTTLAFSADDGVRTIAP